MLKKQYKYNDTIKKDIIIDLFSQFKEELIEEDVKYIELSILIHPKEDKNIDVHLCENVKVNIQSKMLGYISILKKNSSLLRIATTFF